MPKPGRKRKPAPVTLPGAQGRIVEMVHMQDPFEKPGVTAPVMRAVNHSPLDYLLARGRLHGASETAEDGQARHIAGTRLQGLYERAGGSGAGAIDYGKIRVDTSIIYCGSAQSQVDALSELAVIRKKIGNFNYRMLHSICGEQVSFSVWVEREWPGAGRRTRLDAYQILRDGLDALMLHFGVAVGSKSGIKAWVKSEQVVETN